MNINKNEDKNKFLKHRGPVTSVSHIPETNTVVTSAYDGAIGLFDFTTRQVELIGYHEHLANSVVVNEQGTKAASCSADYAVYVWDISSKSLEKKLFGHTDDVEAFVFVGTQFGVSASRDKQIIIWDLQSGKALKTLSGHEKDVLSLAYHNGKLYSSGDDMTLRVWDFNSGELLNTWGPFDVETDTCAIDVERNRVILGCDDGFIKVFNTETGDLIFDIEAHTSGIKKVAVSPANGDILSAAYDQNIHLWSSDDFTLKLSLEKNKVKWERSLDFSADGSKIFAGTFDGTVLSWNAITGDLISEVGEQSNEKGNACLNDIALCGNDYISLVSDDGYVRLVDTKENETNRKFEPLTGRFLMNGIGSSTKFNVVAAGSHDQKLHIFDFENGELKNSKETVINEGPINTIRVSELNGFEKQSFVGCYSGAIVNVDYYGNILNKISIHDGAVKALRLHPNLPIGVSCSAGGELYSWNFNGEVINKYYGHTAIINDVDISPSGNLIASVSRDFTLKVYDFNNGKTLMSISLGTKSLKSVAFSTDNLIFVGDYWGNVFKVNLDSGEVESKKLANNGLSSIAKRNNELIAVSYDGSVYIIDSKTFNPNKKITIMNQRIEKEVLA